MKDTESNVSKDAKPSSNAENKTEVNQEKRITTEEQLESIKDKNKEKGKENGEQQTSKYIHKYKKEGKEVDEKEDKSKDNETNNFIKTNKK